jgi:hypothetical protein
MGAGFVGVLIVDGLLKSWPGGASFLQSKPSSTWQIVVFVIAFWGPILVLPGWLATRSLRENLRRQRARDLDRGQNQACVASLQDTRFVSVVDVQQREFLLYEFGPGRTLALNGERPSRDRALFGLSEDEDDTEALEEDIEGDEDVDDEHEQAPRTPFPNSDCELHWLPHSGRLLQIAARGAPATPQRVLLDTEVALTELKRFVVDAERDVLIIERGLDAVLANARVAT